MSSRRRLVVVVVVVLLALGALGALFAPNVLRLFEPVTDVFPAQDGGAADQPY